MSVRRLAALLAACALVAPVAAADPFKVYVDQTITLKLSSPAQSVVLGNPLIADVQVHDSRTLLVTGKTFGSTNLMVLDGAGNTIFQNFLAVSDNRADQLSITTRTGVETFSCVDKCRPTPNPVGKR